MMKRILVAAVAALTLLIAGTPAVAAETPLDAAKKLTTARIDGRLATLKAEGIAVKNAARLTDAHQSTLEGILSRSTDGLTALRAKVQMETTLDALKADTRSMIDDYRVYLLVTPQSHRIHFVPALVVDPGFDEIGREHVTREQKVVIRFECVERLG